MCFLQLNIGHLVAPNCHLVGEDVSLGLSTWLPFPLEQFKSCEFSVLEFAGENLVKMRHCWHMVACGLALGC